MELKEYYKKLYALQDKVLNAVLGRDEAKDVFDLFIIDKFFNPQYKNIIECAKKKAIFNVEDLIYRLKTFPKSWIYKLNIIDRNLLNKFDLNFIENIKKEVL